MELPLVTSDVCLICGGSVEYPEDREYFRCVACETLRTKYSYNKNLYRHSYAVTYEQYAATDVNTPLNLFRVGLVSRWLKQGNRILDIGCGVGEFIRFAEQYYTCVGFEPNQAAALRARKKVASKIVSRLNLKTISIAEFNCVTMFDVIEHLENPLEFLRAIQSIYLVANGIVAFTTPNVDAVARWDDERLRQWKHYKPKEHLFLYPEAGLNILCEKAGLTPIHWGCEESDIRPGNPNDDILTCVARKV